MVNSLYIHNVSSLGLNLCTTGPYHIFPYTWGADTAYIFRCKQTDPPASMGRVVINVNNELRECFHSGDN